MTESKRALVTGASGYIGSWIAQTLAGDGWTVAGLTRRDVVPVEPQPSRVTMYHVGRDYSTVLRAFEQMRPDVVFHLASVSLAMPGPEDVSSMIDANVLLVAQLADAMVATGVKCLVNAGTYWQYAHDGTVRPTTFYAATKQAAEVVLDYHTTRGIRVVTLVLHDVYGPNDPRPKLIPLLAGLAADASPVDLTAGTQTVDYVHVEDVSRAFVQAADWLLDRGAVRHERFMVRGQRPLALRNVVDLLADVRGVRLPIRWGKRPTRDHDIQEPWLSGAPVPGWTPRITLEEGFRQLLDQG